MPPATASISMLCNQAKIMQSAMVIREPEGCDSKVLKTLTQLCGCCSVNKVCANGWTINKQVRNIKNVDVNMCILQ